MYSHCVVAVTPAAIADPIAQKRAEANTLAAQIDALGRQESALSEQYDKAQIDAQAAAAQVAAAAQQDAAAEAAAARARDALKTNAVEAYLQGGSLAVVASRATDPVSLADGGILRSEYVQSLAGTQADALDRFHLASLQAKEAKAGYQAAQLLAARSAASVNTARSAAAASAQALQATLTGVKGDIATLVAQAQAAKAAADAQAAREAQARLLAQQVASRSAPSAPAVSYGPPPPVGSGAAAAVRAAMSRLGLPYVWGAAGPGSFDCSGLVMWSWRLAGVSLPHFSGAQYSSTTHISMADLQPGDLVFPANPGEHVAMYIGGGMIIQAPHTGAVVSVAPISSWFVLASRP